MKTSRRKSRRVRLAEAVRRDCDPLLKSFGFRNPIRHNWKQFYVSRRNVFFRWRGEYYDEICFHWRVFNRPSFFIEWLTTEKQLLGLGPDDVVPHLIRGRMLSWVLYALGGRINMAGEQFGPWMSIEKTTALANLRLAELNLFLESGKFQRHIVPVSGFGRWPTDPVESNPIFPNGMGDPPADA